MADIVLHAYHEGKCPVQIVDYKWRLETIKEVKPKEEHELRFKRIKKIPLNHLPMKAREGAKILIKKWETYYKEREAYDKAWEAHDKAWEAYDKAWEAHDKAWDAYYQAADAYHKAGDAYHKARDAYYKARDVFESSLPPEEWDKWHKKHCVPECSWSSEHPSIFLGE